MTVGTKVHQALASLRSLEGQLETFALDTDDQQAKQMYNQCRQQLAQISGQLASRVNYMEQEEPTYKVSSGTPSSGGAGNQFSTTGMQGGATGVTGMTGMSNALNTTGLGTDRSIGSTASTGATGSSGWSSPTNEKGSSKSTKNKSR